MPENQDHQQPLDWQAMISAALEEQREAAGLLRKIQRGARVEFRDALNARAEIITAPQFASNVPQLAAQLTQRHQEHYIAPAFVEAMIRLMHDQRDQEAIQTIARLKNQALCHGFFIMEYTAEMMAERLRSPHYVIAEAYGEHPDEEHPYHGLQVAAADCQCWMPEPAERPSEMIDLPGLNDQGHMNKALIDDIVRRPWAYGEVKDISCRKSMNGLGLAGLARRKAFHEIESVVNPGRGQYPIEYMLASIGQLSGIELPDGTPVKLRDFGQILGIRNEHSIAIHTSPTIRYPATWGYTLVDRKTPVNYEGREYNILVDWLMYFHQLKK